MVFAGRQGSGFEDLELLRLRGLIAIERPVKLVRGVTLAIAFVYSLILFLSDANLDSGYKLFLGWLPIIASVLLLVWDLRAWRWPGLHRLTGRPRIDGLWEVTLRPTAESHIPEGGNRGPIPAYLEISQSYWSLHVRQMTVESKSESRSFFWQRLPHTSVDRVSFLYENDPRPEHSPRSPRHLGTCSFDLHSLDPRCFQGTYFTDRYTKGEMEIRFVDRSHGYGTFADAAAYAATVGA